MRAASELVICTRNRPAELERCLESVLAQSVPSLTIFVVDSSDTQAARHVVERAQLKARPGLVLKVMSTEPGLTRQRNAAVDALEDATEFVHFIDDDAVIDVDYVAAIERVFRADAYGMVAGVGGLIQNLPAHRDSWLDRWFLLDSKQEGVVLPSGMNIVLCRAQRPTRVDWISGCAMSFRRRVFDEFRFDASMRGYSIGEDVEFTFRVSRRYQLLITPDARVWHYQASSGREARAGLYRQEVWVRYRLARAYPHDLSVAALVWSCLGRITLGLARGIRRRRRRYLARALGTALGLLDIVVRRSDADAGAQPRPVARGTLA